MAKKYYRATRRKGRLASDTITHGKPFLTKAGKFGCYVYINGKRAYFQEDSELKSYDYWMKRSRRNKK